MPPQSNAPQDESTPPTFVENLQTARAALQRRQASLATLQALYDAATARGDTLTAKRIMPTLAALTEDTLLRTLEMRARLYSAPDPYRSLALQGAQRVRQDRAIRARFSVSHARRAVSATPLASGVEGQVQGGD